ncbi:unnamed protein product [Cochlearia groenlandica]
MLLATSSSSSRLYLPNQTKSATTNTNNNVSSLKNCKTVDELKIFHRSLTKQGPENDFSAITKLVSRSCELGTRESLSFAREVFDYSVETNKSCFMYNSLIRGYASSGLCDEALSLFLRMIVARISPDKYTFPFVLSACAKSRAYRVGFQTHGLIAKTRYAKDMFVENSLVHFYAECGEIVCARKVFDEMSERNVVSWTSLICGYARRDLAKEAVDLFFDMTRDGDVVPNVVTMVCVVSACGKLGDLETGEKVYAFIQKNKIPIDVKLGTALIDMFSRCGDPESAMLVFDSLTNRDVSAWTAAIRTMAMAGKAKLAIELFDEIIQQGLKPDSVAFVGALAACSHGGLVQQGKQIFDSMEKLHGVSPKDVHYGCMVDLLGRAGLLEEALRFIKAMPLEPNDVIWSSLLAACRVQGNVKMAAYAAERIQVLSPDRTGSYVLLSNAYALAQRWDEMAKVRLSMKEKGLRKSPGTSLVVIRGKTHEFTSGDESHPEMLEIEAMLDEISHRASESGHIPDLSNVLMDVDEQEKRFILSRHSEKLAMAYGLITSNKGNTIRIVKNLRVCSDCHTFAKFTSKLYNREIVLRDNNRFHFIQQGKCSCNDFW